MNYKSSSSNNKKSRPVAVDLFSGAGGMTLGFEQAGFDVLCSFDIDPIHCATHAFNFPQWKTICSKVEDITKNEIRRAIGTQEIDVVFGGPPCQGFSLIGKRLLNDPRNRLLDEFLRIVLEIQPKLFVMENVAGLVSGKHQSLLLELVEAAKAGGYSILKPWQVLNAADFGVPQSRKRLFLVGVRKGLTLPDYPAPTHRNTRLNGSTPEDLFDLPPTPSVDDAIGDIPDVDQFIELVDDDKVTVEYVTRSRYGKILRGLVNDPDDLSYPRKNEANLLTSSLRTKHTKLSRSRFSATLPGTTEPISRFYKLDPKGISNTLRAGTGSNRGAFTSPRPIHPSFPRCITVREAARLHSYPDWFRFHATKWHGFRQIGNSVPPLLARSIAQQVAKVLRTAPKKPKKYIVLDREWLLNCNMTEAASFFGVSPDVVGRRVRGAKNG